MIKVLQIIDGKSFGGIAKLMLEVQENISKDIVFDFLTATNIYDEWNNLNISRDSVKGRIIYNYRLLKFLKKNEYDIVHINSGAFFFTFQVLLISKIAGIKKIIVHSHNTPYISGKKRFLIKLLNPIYSKIIDVKLTCSNKATKSLFTKSRDVILIKNGINVEKFRYNENARKQERKSLEIDEKVVYGHIGRFAKQKNHEFLIDVFYELQKKQNAVLLLVGNGELENEIKEKVKRLKIENKVLFLGFRKDVNNLLNAMDIFLFPSLYEGLPVTLVEAQTSGLPVFVSNGVTKEANISNNFYVIDEYNCCTWVNSIFNVKLSERENAYTYTIKNGYGIKSTSKQLEEIYKKLMNYI